MGKTRARGGARGRNRKARNGKTNAGTQSLSGGSPRSMSPSPSHSRYSSSPTQEEDKMSGAGGTEVSLRGSGTDVIVSNLESLAQSNGWLQTELERVKGQGDTSSPGMNTLIEVIQSSQRMVTQNRAQIQLLSGCFQDLTAELKKATATAKVQEGQVNSHCDEVEIQGTTYDLFCERKADLEAKVDEMKKKVGQLYKGKRTEMGGVIQLPEMSPQAMQTEVRRPVETAVGTDDLDPDPDEFRNSDSDYIPNQTPGISDDGEIPDFDGAERESCGRGTGTKARTPTPEAEAPVRTLRTERTGTKGLPSIKKPVKQQRVRRGRSKNDAKFYVLPNNRKRPDYAYSPRFG